jgi:hypothetical protein
LFVTAIVYVIDAPAVTVAAPAFLVMTRSAVAGASATVAMLVLLAGVASGVVGAIVAVLETGAVRPAFVVTLSVNDAVGRRRAWRSCR